jgi:hypothetical protein
MLIMISEKKLETQRRYRRITNNIATKKYEKTKSGFLMRCYRNMKSRISGIQKEKAHLYKGKFLLDKKDFYSWSITQDSFNNLFNKWVENNYDRKLTPSVNRINPKLGYELNNIEWITHSENSRLGNLSRFNRLNNDIIKELPR